MVRHTALARLGCKLLEWLTWSRCGHNVRVQEQLAPDREVLSLSRPYWHSKGHRREASSSLHAKARKPNAHLQRGRSKVGVLETLLFKDRQSSLQCQILRCMLSEVVR